MKKLLCLALAVLALLSCACAAQPDACDNDALAEVSVDAPMVDLAANTNREVRENPTEKGYTRGGNYASMTWREINALLGVDTNNA